MEVRIGELLVRAGVLTEAQVRGILDHQRRSGTPFGLLCERLHDVAPEAVEAAWAEQYATLTRTVDPLQEAFDEHVRDLVSRRQAWQFRAMPLRFDGDELMIATTVRDLRRALGFASNVIGVPCYLVVSGPEQLAEALCRYYALPGMTVEALLNGGPRVGNGNGRLKRGQRPPEHGDGV